MAASFRKKNNPHDRHALTCRRNSEYEMSQILEASSISMDASLYGYNAGAFLSNKSHVEAQATAPKKRFVAVHIPFFIENWGFPPKESLV
jgi:hypothetical protein